MRSYSEYTSASAEPGVRRGRGAGEGHGLGLVGTWRGGGGRGGPSRGSILGSILGITVVLEVVGRDRYRFRS